MQIRFLASAVALALLLSACAEQQAKKTSKVPERGDPEYFKVRDSMADEVYVNKDAAKLDWIDEVRRIYIAPANTSRTQIIQPHGVRAGDIDAWTMDDEEHAVMQNKFFRSMSESLESGHAFHVVDHREDAQAVLYSRVIAVHPYEPKSVVDAGGTTGGSVTMSFSLVDPVDRKVMVRMLDSKSTDDIWAFHNMTEDGEENQDALELIFSSWGYQIRRSMLFLQGRLNAVEPAVQLKPQT